MSYDMIRTIQVARARQKRVLKLRAGGATFEAIAQARGVSRQRVYQIHHEAKIAEKRGKR